MASCLGEKKNSHQRENNKMGPQKMQLYTVVNLSHIAFYTLALNFFFFYNKKKKKNRKYLKDTEFKIFFS